MNKRLIVLSSISILLISGVSAVALNLTKSTETPSMTQPTKSQKADTKSTPDVTFRVDQSDIVTPTPTAAPEAVTPVVPVVTPTPVITPVTPSLMPIRFQTEMAAAGIAESDYQAVATLMLTADGWVPSGSSFIINQVINKAMTPTDRFTVANLLVRRTYGSWDAALARATATNGNW